nr:unnamed protein product [Meloidogyne enterolobii]
MQSDMLMTYGVLDANQLDNICKLFKNSKDIKQTTINVLTRLGHLVLNKKEDFKDYLINDYQIGGAVDKEYKCSKKEFEDWIKCFSAKCKIFGNRINFGYKLHFPEGNDSTYSLIESEDEASDKSETEEEEEEEKDSEEEESEDSEKEDTDEEPEKKKSKVEETDGEEIEEEEEPEEDDEEDEEQEEEDDEPEDEEDDFEGIYL